MEEEGRRGRRENGEGPQVTALPAPLDGFKRLCLGEVKIGDGGGRREKLLLNEGPSELCQATEFSLTG